MGSPIKVNPDQEKRIQRKVAKVQSRKGVQSDRETWANASGMRFIEWPLFTESSYLRLRGFATSRWSIFALGWNPWLRSDGLVF